MTAPMSRKKAKLCCKTEEKFNRSVSVAFVRLEAEGARL